MKDEPHHLQHSVEPSSTVIHHYEEDETLLARWLRRGLEKGPKFWVFVGGCVAALIALTVLVSGLMMGKSEASQAWRELLEARTSDQQVKVADTYPKTEASRWALLEAASAVYNDGFNLQSTNRDASAPLLKKAYSLYEQVYQESVKIDEPVARRAAFGKARTLEASNDLSGAIAQYQSIAKTWPDTPEAKRAAALAKALQNSKNADFYTWLASYKPAEMTLPPLGKGTFDFPPQYPPAAADAMPGVGVGSVPTSELPTNVFEPPLTPTPEGAAEPTPAPAQDSKDGTPKP
jgi:hypothetical protein